MTFISQSQLQNDSAFTSRCSACITQQSQAFINDAREDIKALASAWLSGGWTGGTSLLSVWMPIMASEPGFADTVDNGDGTISSSNIEDTQILASVQSQYPAVAGLFFNQDGSPKP